MARQSRRQSAGRRHARRWGTLPLRPRARWFVCGESAALGAAKVSSLWAAAARWARPSSRSGRRPRSVNLIRVTLDSRAVRWSGLPMPHRRTFADAIVASAHSDRPALRHPAFAWPLKPAPGPWATPPDPMVQQDRLGREDQVGTVSQCQRPAGGRAARRGETSIASSPPSWPAKPCAVFRPPVEAALPAARWARPSTRSGRRPRSVNLTVPTPGWRPGGSAWRDKHRVIAAIVAGEALCGLSTAGGGRPPGGPLGAPIHTQRPQAAQREPHSANARLEAGRLGAANLALRPAERKPVGAMDGPTGALFRCSSP